MPPLGVEYGVKQNSSALDHRLSCMNRGSSSPSKSSKYLTYLTNCGIETKEGEISLKWKREGSRRRKRRNLFENCFQEERDGRYTPRAPEGLPTPFAERFSGQFQHILQELPGTHCPASRSVKSFLHGTWLGRPLHPILTDIPSLPGWSPSYGMGSGSLLRRPGPDQRHA